MDDRVRMIRTMELAPAESEGEESGLVTCTASTDAPADFGFMREVLAHGPENVDFSGANSALFNHDPNQVIGKIAETRLENGRMVARLEVDGEVKGSNGMGILKAIRKGYLKGISIGYDYDRRACKVTEDESGNRTATVDRWRLLEISVTPTPRDSAAAIEARRDAFSTPTMEGPIMDPVKTPEVPAVDNTAVLAAEERAAKAEGVVEMLELARSHGLNLPAADLAGLNREGAKDLILKRLAESKTQDNPKGSQVVVSADVTDKVDAAAEDALLHLAGIKQERDLGMRNRGVLDIGRQWLAGNGNAGAAFLSKHELAGELLGISRRGRVTNRRDAANITSGMFTSYLLANVQDKAIQKGFDSFPTTYGTWAGSRSVSDFKQFTGAALDVGNLVKTAENAPFPELNRAEAGYNGTLGLWGVTQSLTLQALINDDLGEFMRSLTRIGSIAKRTVDKEVYTQLAAASWTGRTASSSALADSTLTARRSDLERLAGPAGEKMGQVARYLVVPSGLRGVALGLTQIAPYIAPTSVLANPDLVVVSTPHLAHVTTATNSTWYLAADQAVADTVIVATLVGYETPRVEEFDAGAVAARKWKVMLPFVVVVPTIYGMYRGTLA